MNTLLTKAEASPIARHGYIEEKLPSSTASHIALINIGKWK